MSGLRVGKRVFLLRRERDGTTSSFHFARSFTLSQFECPLSRREGWDRSVTFSSLTFSLNTRAFTSLSRRERDGTAQSHSVPSPPSGLRPVAVILDRAVFASLSRGQSNPLRGFSSTNFSLETKSEALRLRFSFQRRERDWIVRSLSVPTSPHSRQTQILSQYEKFSSHSQGERGIGRRTHFVSFAALRVTAGGRNP